MQVDPCVPGQRVGELAAETRAQQDVAPPGRDVLRLLAPAAVIDPTFHG